MLAAACASYASDGATFFFPQYSLATSSLSVSVPLFVTRPTCLCHPGPTRWRCRSQLLQNGVALGAPHQHVPIKAPHPCQLRSARLPRCQAPVVAGLGPAAWRARPGWARRASAMRAGCESIGEVAGIGVVLGEAGHLGGHAPGEHPALTLLPAEVAGGGSGLHCTGSSTRMMLEAVEEQQTAWAGAAANGGVLPSLAQHTGLVMLLLKVCCRPLQLPSTPTCPTCIIHTGGSVAGSSVHPPTPPLPATPVCCSPTQPTPLPGPQGPAPTQATHPPAAARTTPP